MASERPEFNDLKRDFETAETSLEQQIAIRYWGQKSLSVIGSPEELIILSELRKYENDDSRKIREAVADIFHQRWGMIGIHEKVTPVRIIPGFDQDKNPYFNGPFDKGIGTGYGEETRIAILTLAKAFEQKKNLSREEFDRTLILLLGPKTVTKHIYDKLRDLYIFSEPHRADPIVVEDKETIVLHENAFKHLEPHLDVLTAISYPTEIMPMESGAVLIGIRKILHDSLYGNFKRWKKSDLDRLLYSEKRLIFPSINSIESMVRDEQMYGSAEGFSLKQIPFLSKNRLYLLIKNQNAYSRTTEDSFQIVSNFYSDNELFTDYQGRLVSGREVGRLRCMWRNMDAHGSFIPRFLREKLPIESVYINEEEFSIHLEVPVGELNIFTSLRYANNTPQGGTVVGENLNQIAVSIKNPKAFDEDGKPAEDRHMFIGRYIEFQLELEELEAFYNLELPDGRYSLKQQVFDDKIILTYETEGHREIVSIPTFLPVLEVTKNISRKTRRILKLTGENREKIIQDTQNISVVPISDMMKMFDLPNDLIENMISVENQIKQMDDFQQRAMKIFIYSYLSEFNEDENIYIKMSEVVKRYNLDIDQKTIELADEVMTKFLNVLKSRKDSS